MRRSLSALWAAVLALALAATAAASAPTDHEQLLVELINRARLDPVEEAARFGIGLDDGLPAGTIPPVPVPPLAFDEMLGAAAVDHTFWMIGSNTFSHTGAGGSEFWERIEAAGYVNWSNAGENIAWRGTTGTLDDATILQFVFVLHQMLFESPGHRENLLSPNFRELGVGAAWGAFAPQGTSYNSVVTTHDFASAFGSDAFLTGVVFDDLDADDFYAPGEGVGEVEIVAQTPGGGTFRTTSWPSGGYSLELPPGSYDVTASGGGIAPITAGNVVVGGENVKVDFVVPEPDGIRGLAAGIGLVAVLARRRRSCAPHP